nr:permease prefix domain 2-containing transporter [Bradyrhizobium sp. 193]
MTWNADELPDGNVDLQIVHEDGEMERIVLRLPPLAPRQEMIEAALRSIVHERQAAQGRLYKEHAVLRARIDALQANADLLQAHSKRRKAATPPILAELFISFLAPKNSAQGLLGDLQELFQKNAERYGTKQARQKYWIEVARSFGPLLWQWLKRVGFFTVLIDYFRSKFGF